MGAATETDVCLLESFRAEWASLRLERQTSTRGSLPRDERGAQRVEARDARVRRLESDTRIGPSARRSTVTDSEQRRGSQRSGSKPAARVDWPRRFPNASHIDE